MGHPEPFNLTYIEIGNEVRNHSFIKHLEKNVKSDAGFLLNNVLNFECKFTRDSLINLLRYDYRWPAYVANLTALFPNLSTLPQLSSTLYRSLHSPPPVPEFIATSYVGNPVLTPKPLQYDVHVYNTPST